MEKWDDNWDEFVKKITPYKWHDPRFPLEVFNEKRNQIQKILQERGIWLHAIHIEEIEEYKGCYEIKVSCSFQVDKKLSEVKLARLHETRL